MSALATISRNEPVGSAGADTADRPVGKLEAVRGSGSSPSRSGRPTDAPGTRSAAVRPSLPRFAGLARAARRPDLDRRRLERSLWRLAVGSRAAETPAQ
jgi:hypothetical protein